MMPPGVAFATIGDKTGAGRNTRQPDAIRHVEASECRAPVAGLPTVLHVLVNDARATTRCRTCGDEWWALDERLNAGAKSRGRE